MPVLYDGPLMRGTDVVKLLALGAKGVVLDHQMEWGFVHQVSRFELQKSKIKIFS